MAKSKYEYVKNFELPDSILPSTYIVVRIDGKGFTKFTQTHEFIKPTDKRAIELMNLCALEVVKALDEITVAYGQSDEYSFLFKKDCQLFERRSSKLATTVVSIFTANYVFHWSKYFPDTHLQLPPSFDGRSVCYPNIEVLRDYFSWRQVDCHINHLYNLCFWKLVQSGVSRKSAEKQLSGTVSKDKHELLFSKFDTNYNDEPEMYKKGTVIIRSKYEGILDEHKNPVKRKKFALQTLHVDIIKKNFWDTYPDLLE
ncbi:tRNAHis guanylyltransferase [Conidiobolus coronatus NRRL 28638]|uniref:tRNA(His) guanylyltransferase n=1 Tax=Conidiobolus coronatus (strain ATCC 28846 / CBS 209.66 / NRRL 28638) TaxID=796925 RepID=A0A137PHV5_CONC2|nr:tRNAHis guanylyltransferase [Conidiobolus coronatus NRRL 28638]|eukprot:KXN74511.1 tRNAHis guanylyltransferase [Conidiobolus coronatus NRRL 28638]